MLFLIKLFPEITIKSRPVRRRQTRQLRKNIRAVLVELDPHVVVIGEWDSIEVHPSEQVLTNPGSLRRMRERLADTPGISLLLEVDKHPLPDLQGILDLALASFGPSLAGKTFAVRCKRSGRQAFKSTEVERFVGAGLMAATGAAGVNLDNPDVTVSLEVREQSLYIVRATHQGLGGFPLGCQSAVLSLLSGGYDSSVSSYLCIKRGLQTHYCFFNLGGRAHELAVKEVALFLWEKFHSSHRVQFITVPFEPVVNEILRRVDNAQMAVILKRMMLRAAARISESLEINGLCTGESIAQVASQTLANLSVIDEVTDALVLRPLITWDKQEIIDLARHIGTEEFSRTIPEYCSVISRSPTTRARRERVLSEEARIDMSVLDAAIDGAQYQIITELVDDFDDNTDDVDVVSIVAPGDTVIDIRHPAEAEASPLRLNNPEQLQVIPFYDLQKELADTDRQRRLLLFCARGMISRLHAAHLQDDGFQNIAVLDLSQPAAARAG